MPNNSNLNANLNIRGFNMMKLLMIFALIPIILSSLLLNFVSNSILEDKLDGQFENQVYTIDSQFNRYVTEIYQNVGESFFTGEKKDYTYVDKFLKQDIVMTIFIGDTRVLTSLTDSSGKRIEGTKASAEVIQTVLNNGQEYAKDDAEINGVKYYVHYLPVKDANGNIIGMTFAGKKASLIEADVKDGTSKLLLSTASIIILALIVVFFVSKKVRKALVAIAAYLNQLATGDIHAEFNIPTSIAENKRMVEALSGVKDMLNESMDKVKTATDKISTGIDSVEYASAESAAAANQIESAVEELTTMAQNMAGNVSNVNSSVSNMDVTVSDIGSNIEVLADNSGAINDASAEAASCIDKVLDSNKVSVDAVESINKQILLTNDSINKINEAITLIIGVANRTKLLSLNASIEAARAGEAGRGFAVVAQNISQLSEQSNDSAATIRAIAEEMLSNSSETVKLAEDIINTMSDEQKSIADAKDRFAKLNDAINDSLAKIKEIDEKTDSLNAIKAEIVTDVDELSAIAQENAARNQEVNGNVANIVGSIEDIAKNMANMKEVKDSLIEATSVFK